MGEYKPFLIAPFKYGKEVGLQPWLLPKDAFSELKNAYLRRGVINKRGGAVEFDQFVHAVADEGVGTFGLTNYTGTLNGTPLRAGDLSFTDGTSTITDDGDGTLSGDGTGTINYTTGAFDITFSGVTVDVVYANYDFYPGEAIVGIHDYKIAAGDIDMLVWDTLRMCKYDTGSSKLEDVVGADTWTGDSANFMWTENWQDRIFMVNNNDRMKSWNGTALTNVLMDIDDDTSNDVTTAKMIFLYKERLVVLYTTEGGSAYPQRARWCVAGDPDDWVDADNGGTGGYVDAPTNDSIVSAGFLGDDLIVWFNKSVWKLRYTGDSDLPFRWDRVMSDDGSYATFSTIDFANELLTVGATSLLKTNGFDTVLLNDKMPDAVLDIDPEKFDYVNAIKSDEMDQVLISYPKTGSSTSDQALIYNFKEDSFSTYDWAYQCFGQFTEKGSFTIDTHPLADVALDDIEITFDDRTQAAGFPILLAGDTSGYLWQVNSGGDDDGSAIELEIITGRWNPFIDQGMKARLGWVDFLVDRDPDIDIDVKFYVNQDPAYYLEETVTFDGVSDTEDKVWKRVFCGGVGEFHRLRLYHSAVNQTARIHAIMPYFKPAGKIR